MTSNQLLNTIILDGRSVDKYDKEHIDGSYSISLPHILIKRIITNPEKFIEYIFNVEVIKMIKKIKEEKVGLILYLIDDDFSEILRKSLENFYNDLIQFILYDDYKIQKSDTIKITNTVKFTHKLFNENNPVIQSPQHTFDMRFEMSEIIQGLYLSGEEIAMNNELLKKNNILYILNATNHIPFYHETEFTYYRIPLVDNPNINIRQYFDETYKIIDEIITDNKKILIHCHAGISRSATIVIAYIMKKNKITMNEAYKIVQKGRPCISPNLGFCGQLMLYEKDLMIN
jgi:protein-tyrosine phosphatase